MKKVFDRLRQENQDPDKLMAEIKDIIVKTILPIQSDLAHNYRTCQPADHESTMCFQILGFDILLDKNCKPYLLEVNHAPSFATDTPLDYEIKHGLISDTFKLLNLTVQRKKQKLKTLFFDKKFRNETKMTLKQKCKLKQVQMDEFRKE